jgi:hypothetical protein
MKKEVHMRAEDDGGKAEAYQALSILYRRAVEMSAELLVLARYVWNMEMKLLKVARVMPLFVAYPWLLVVLAFLLPVIAPPLGAVFWITGIAAGFADASADHEFIVPLRVRDNNTPAPSTSFGPGDMEPSTEECDTEVRHKT